LIATLKMAAARLRAELAANATLEHAP